MQERNWGTVDSANSIPLWVTTFVNQAPTPANVAQLYKNSTVQNLGNSIVGIFPTVNGWVLRRTTPGGRSGRVTEELLQEVQGIQFSGSGTLQPLYLTSNTILENVPTNTVVGNIIGRTPGSTLTLSNDAGGRFAIVGNTVVVGSVTPDYDTYPVSTITIVETLATAINSPKSSKIDIGAINVFEKPNLGVLGLSNTYITTGTFNTINIIGASNGSIISSTSIPAGMLLNSAARTITGIPLSSAGTYTILLVETLDDSANSPKQTSIGGVVIADPPKAPNAPIQNDIIIGDGQLGISWTDSSPNGSAITSHSVYLNGVFYANTTNPSPFVITGIPNGVEVYVEVTATNGIGESQPSAKRYATPQASSGVLVPVNALINDTTGYVLNETGGYILSE